MGFFGNLFAKKNCSICGGEIGLLGNRKLEDGNMCKHCAAKLSPWFSDRRSSTVAQIEEQLAYREENKQKVAQFNVTRSMGMDHVKVLLDEDKGQFLIAKGRQWKDANPDVLTLDQITGCVVDIEETKREEMCDGPDNKKVSYEPRRYTYYYDFHVEISVNHPYFDQMRFQVNSGSVEESYQDRLRYAGSMGRTTRPIITQDPNGSSLGNLIGAVVNSVASASAAGNAPAFDGHGDDYHEYRDLAYEIRDALTPSRRQAREEAAPETVAPSTVQCPYCDATTTPDANGCCEYCGSQLQS